jgi:hypothetical protein
LAEGKGAVSMQRSKGFLMLGYTTSFIAKRINIRIVLLYDWVAANEKMAL